MPLSKCRICGKKIPNPYRQYHERKQCIKARQLRGEYISPDIKKAEAEREKEKLKKELPYGQKRLLEVTST